MIDVEVTASTTHLDGTLRALLNIQPDMRAVDGEAGVALTDVPEHQHHGSQPIVMMLDRPTDADVLAALASGARGLVTRDCRIATVAQAVRAVADGLCFVTPALTDTVAGLVAHGRHRRSGPEA